MAGGFIAIALTLGLFGLFLAFGEPLKRLWWHVAYGEAPPAVTPEPSFARTTATNVGYGTAILSAMILLVGGLMAGGVEFQWAPLIPPIVGVGSYVIVWAVLSALSESDESSDNSESEFVDEAYPDEDDNPAVEW